jgi:Phytochelatin synthase
MVMNALRIPAPTTPEFTPYHAFTQGDFLNDATEKILPRAVLAKQSMTLDQIAQLAETYPVRAEVYHASDASLDEFRTVAKSYLKQKDHYILVNYLRRVIGEERGGISRRWLRTMPMPTAFSYLTCRGTNIRPSGSRLLISSPP